MVKINPLIHSFNSGELSKAGLARVDNEKVRLCAEVQENLFPYTIGKAIMRPGTKYLGTATSLATVDLTDVNSPPRLIPFVKSLSTKALLEIGYDLSYDFRLRVWINDALVVYPSVTSTIGAITSLTTVTTGDAVVSLTAAYFTAHCPNKGGTVIVKKQVSTSSANIEHAIWIKVVAGEIDFRIGSADGGDDYLSATTLGVGYHVLSFTPTASSYWIRFFVDSPTSVTVQDLSIYNNSASITLAVPALVPFTATNFGRLNLRSIRYDQSLDTVFLSMPDAGPCKIERRGNRSWSFVQYVTVNGPFMIGRSNTSVRLKPAATYGNTTLTADNPFFTSSHKGVLFKLTHDNFNASFGLAGTGQYTDPFRVTGVKYTGQDDRAFSVVVSGTWVGTINIQRSYNDELSGYQNFGANITTNGTTSVAGDTNDANAIVWYRVIFTSYTSGSAQVTLHYNGYGSSGICRVTSVTNSTSADVEIITPFTDTTYTESWQQGEWSDDRGYPTAVALFDGRLWWARRDRFWGSVSDNYYSYDVTVTGDSASVQRDVATGGNFSEIQWLLPLQRLILGTAGAEASARASSLDEPLTPTAITVKDGSSFGAANVTPLKVDGRGIFVQRSGRKLMELSYGVQKNDYGAVDLMRYNETIGTALDGIRIAGLVDNDIVELAVQRHPETYIWCIRDDGVVPVLIYNPDQDVLGWFRFIPGSVTTTTYLDHLQYDKVGSVAVLPGETEDSVYFIVGRRGGPIEDSPGEIYTFSVEKLEYHQSGVYKKLGTGNTVDTYNGLYQLDSYETGTVGTDGVTVTITNRLAPTTVMVIGPQYDSSGNITSYGPIGDTYDLSHISYPDPTDTLTVFPLSETNMYRAGATVTVGLPYTGKYKSAKLAYGAEKGTSLLQPKKVALTGVLLSDYHPNGILIGSDFDDVNAMDELPKIEKGYPIDANTTLPATLDGNMFPFPGVWDTDARLCIEVKPGYSATLHALVVGMETNQN